MCSSHVSIAMCGPRGSVYDKELGEWEFKGSRQLLNTFPAHTASNQSCMHIIDQVACICNAFRSRNVSSEGSHFTRCVHKATGQNH